MAQNNRQLAVSVLEEIGGTENVEEAFHCMTRLRFRLRDSAKADLEKIKSIQGVLGAQFAEDTLQVVIGPSVGDVYKELVKTGGLKEGAKAAESHDRQEKSENKKAVKRIPEEILNTFSNSMTPLVPLFVAMGMMNIVASVLGPAGLNIAAESDIYKDFYYAAQAIVYFLPVFVAITASKHFGANSMISVALAGAMLYPDMIEALSADGGFTIYGIPAANAAYGGQVIPVLLIVWAQAHLEKLLNKLIPNSLKVIGTGFLTLVLMLPLTFCVFGPAGVYLSSALSNILFGLYDIAGPVETALLCAGVPFLTAFGYGRPIFFATMIILMSSGVEYSYMPVAMVLNNFIIMGITAGYAVKAGAAEKRKLGVTCLVSSAFGGVSEPALFGIILKNPKTYPVCVISGLAGGFYLGLMRVGYYQFGPSNVLSVLGFIGGDGASNMANGCIASAICFAAAFVGMLVVFKEKQE